MPHVEIPQAEFKLVILGDANCGKTSLITRFAQGYFRQQPLLSSNNKQQQPGHSPRYSSSSAKPSSPIRNKSNPNFVTKSIPVPPSNIPTKIQIWDVPGAPAAASAAAAGGGPTPTATAAARCYYSTSSAILIGYDVTSRSSYESRRSWLNELRKSVPFNVVVVAIVGLKTDLLISHFHNSKSSNSNNSAAIEAVPEYEVEQLAQALNVLYVPTSSKLDLNVMTLFTKVAEEVLERRRKGVTVASSSSSLVASSNRMGPNTASAPSLALDSCNNNKGGKGNFSSQREHHQQQQRGGIVGLGGANADAGAKKTNYNKNDETTSAVLSPKELYGKYYEKINDETNILYNNNDGIDSTNDHRDDRNAAVTKDKRFSLNNNNVNTMDDPSNYNPSNENNNNNSHNKRRRKSKGSSLSSPSGCGAMFCMNQGVKNVDSCELQEEAEGGDGDNYDCDITMDENDINVDDDHVKHDAGAGDGSCKNESFFLMCGNPTWCGKTTDTI